MHEFDGTQITGSDEERLARVRSIAVLPTFTHFATTYQHTADTQEERGTDVVGDLRKAAQGVVWTEKNLLDDFEVADRVNSYVIVKSRFLGCYAFMLADEKRGVYFKPIPEPPDEEGASRARGHVESHSEKMEALSGIATAIKHNQFFPVLCHFCLTIIGMNGCPTEHPPGEECHARVMTGGPENPCNTCGEILSQGILLIEVPDDGEEPYLTRSGRIAVSTRENFGKLFKPTIPAQTRAAEAIKAGYMFLTASQWRAMKFPVKPCEGCDHPLHEQGVHSAPNDTEPLSEVRH